MFECYEFEECEYNGQPKCCLPDDVGCPHGVKNHKPTNADRTRSMSDEELAELLITADFCGECEYCDKVWECRYYEAHPDGALNDGCKQAAINWLGQPAE